MTVLTPTSLDGALAALAARPDAHVLAGGTDLMVEVNFGHRRPPAVLALAGVPELRGWHHDGEHLWLGAGTTYTELLTGEVARLVPALAQAARTVGSPQIRNAGTLGGNLGTASPAGDALPVLLALDAEVELRSLARTRTLPLAAYLVGVKRTARAADELVVGVRVPVLDGPQQFLKVGVRNAMVIAVASLAVVVDRGGRGVRIAMGAVGPTVLRAHDAEAALASAVRWPTLRLDDDLPGGVDGIASAVAAAARPIDDHRSTAAYRRRAVEVMARRALTRVLDGS